MTEDDYSDPTLEKAVLGTLLRNPQDALPYFSTIESRHFSNDTIRRLFSYTKRLALDSGVTPSKETLRIVLLERYPGATDVIQGLLNIYDELLALPTTTSLSFLVTRLINFARARNAITSAKNLIEGLSGGEIEPALQKYQEDALALQAHDPSTFITRGEVIEDYEMRRELVLDMAANPDKYHGVLTGIDELDQVTGGLWKGELGFVFGKSGVGKSFLLLEFAYQAYRAGCKVLVIPIEMPLIQWERRLDARLAHISYEAFKWGTLTAAELAQWEQRIQVMKDKYTAAGGAIYITHIPMGCTLGAVRVELETFLQQGTPVDMLMIDYADLMTPPRQLYSEQGELTAIFKELKGMAGAYNIPIWTATQAKKEAYNSVYLNMSDVGYAMGKVHVADLVLGISRTDEGALSNRMNLSISKYRDGAYNKPIILNTNLALAMVNAIGV